MGSFTPSSPCCPPSFYLILLEDVKKEVYGNTDSNSRNLQTSTMIDKWKKLKTRMLSFPFCYTHIFLLSTLICLAITITKSWGRLYHELYLVIQSFIFILSTNFIPTTQVDGESQQKGERRPQRPSTNSGSTSNGSNQGQHPTACHKASLIP